MPVRIHNSLIPLPLDMSDLIILVAADTLIYSVSGFRNQDSASVLAIDSLCNGAKSGHGPSGSITSLQNPVITVLTEAALSLRRIHVAYPPLQCICVSSIVLPNIRAEFY